MKRLSVAGLFGGKFDKNQQTLFWINGQAINVIAGKKRKTHKFNVPTGFLASKVVDYEQAFLTIKKVCLANDLAFGNIFAKKKAIIFIPTDTSPVERMIFTNLFAEVGFNDVELRNYETAFSAFLAKQDYEKGSFAYIGREVSEIGVFADKQQQSFVIYYSLTEAINETIYFFREKHLFEISEDVALNIYQEIGLQGDRFSLVVRGRNSRNKELQTVSFSYKEIEALYSYLQKKILQEIDSVMQNNIFKQISSDKWVVLGDDFFRKNLDLLDEKTLQLKSEFDLMQGVEWL